MYYIDIVLVGYLESDVTDVNKVEYVDKVNTNTNKEQRKHLS